MTLAGSPWSSDSNIFAYSSIIGIKDNAEGIIPPDDWANIYRVQ